ncbi:hypothetical protein LJY25_07540 [Hymenobacter sp. BT175]|uniref:MFS transporter n=1 Tax=Hymenobacter translucens TaxID=2886507 RepID=UPI001D0E1F7B|nr:MFS transporter [Hymenobacter translucens]MCC2546294.1 hypothetical protein [Hymenobacter translucens]
MNQSISNPALSGPVMEQAGKSQWKLLLGIALLERICYYGVRSLFALYLIQRLRLPRADAGLVYEAATVLIYLLPVLGAWFADRWWGPVRTLRVGSLLLVLGGIGAFVSGLLPADGPAAEPAFLVGIGLITAATSLFKPAYYAVAGHLTREQPAPDLPLLFWVMLVVNVGAFLAPLLIGSLGDTGNPEDFRWGFLSCVVLSLVVAFLTRGLREPDPAAPWAAPRFKWGWLVVVLMAVGAVLVMLYHLPVAESWVTLLEAGGAVVLLLALVRDPAAAAFRKLGSPLWLLGVSFLGLVANFGGSQFMQTTLLGDKPLNPSGLILLSFVFIAGGWFWSKRRQEPGKSPGRRVLLWALIALFIGLAACLVPLFQSSGLLLTLTGFGALLLLFCFETAWNVLIPVVLAREVAPHLLARSIALFFLLFTLAYKASGFLFGS